MAACHWNGLFSKRWTSEGVVYVHKVRFFFIDVLIPFLGSAVPKKLKKKNIMVLAENRTNRKIGAENVTTVVFQQDF